MSIAKLIPVIMDGKKTSYTFDFTGLSDGALPSPLTGSTWTIASGAALNTPTMGANIIAAGKGVFTSDIESWAALGGNLVTNDGGELKIVYVDTAGGALLNLIPEAEFSAVPVVNERYRFEFDGRVNAGGNVSVTFRSEALYYNSQSITSTVKSTYSLTLLNHGAVAREINISLFGAGETTWLDNLKLYQLTSSDLFASIAMPMPATFDMKAAATGALASTQAGVWVGDGANPTNYIMATCERAKVALWKKVGSTISVVYSTNTAYVAGALIELRRTAATTYQLWYNGSQIGTNQTISDAGLLACTHVGLYSTRSDTTFANFSIERL